MAAQLWKFDPAHSTAHFAVRHMMVSTVRGAFQKVGGTAMIDDDDLTRSSVQVEIEAASIDTREPKRDGHLKSADFLDAEKFPTLTFRSTKVEKGKGEKFKVVGDVTIRGVTRPMVLQVDALTPPMKDPYGKMVRGVSAHGKLNRKEFGLMWNAALEAGGVLVGDEVVIDVDAELQPG